MNRNMMLGIIAGIGIAVAGGVAGFSLMGTSGTNEEPTGAQADVTPLEEAAVEAPVAPAPVAAQPRVQSPAPQPSAPAARPAPAPAPEPVAAAEPECWEEEVEVPADPRDDKAIAGTAAGAVIGGALADRLGDDDDLVTAAGAAAGAFIGRRAQRKFQENRTTTTTVTRCAQQ